MKFSQASKSLALGALLLMAAVASAQDSMNKSLYERLGGIHKIAMVVDQAYDQCAKDPVLMANHRFHKATQTYPKPLVCFYLTGYVASKTGGPQMYSGPDMAAGDKWFMFTQDQMDADAKIWDGVMKGAGYDSQTIADFDKWWMDAMMAATPMAPAPEMIQDKESLYGRLGGVAGISLVVDDFINRLASDMVIGANPNTVKSLTSGDVTGAGLKYLVTEQLAAAAGGPWKYSGRSMADAHKGLMISEKEWNEGGKLLVESLDKYHVPEREKNEVLAAVVATKGDIVNK